MEHTGFLCRLIFVLGVICTANVSASNSNTSLEAVLQSILALEDKTQIIQQGEYLLLDERLQVEQRKQLLKHVGSTLVRGGDYALSEPYFHQLLALSPDPLEEHRFFAEKMLGVSTYYQGHYKQAISFYKTALETAKLRQQPLEIASIENNLGVVYADTGRPSLTAKHYLKAQEIYERLGNDHDRADILVNLSAVYVSQDRFDTAEQMLLEAEELFTKLNLPYGVGLVDSNLAVVYLETRAFDKAVAHIDKAIAYYRTVPDPRQLVVNYSHLAVVRMMEGHFDKAEQAIREAEYYQGQAKNDLSALLLATVRGKWYYSQGMFNELKEDIKLISSLAKKLNDPIKEIHATMLSALDYAAAGNYEQGLVLLEKFLTTLRILRSQEFKEQLTEFENNYAAQQLSLELKELRQQQAFDALEATKERQSQVIIGLIAILALTAGVAWYVRRVARLANERLAIEVNEQTLELQSIASELRHANSVKSQFLANMSHEIRTPLTAILGHAQLLQQKSVSDLAMADSIAVILKQGQHLHELINDVLDLSRIEADQLQIQETTFNLATLLSELKALFAVTAQAKRLEFTVCEELPGSFWIETDYIRLKQILVNLLGNAIKFTEHGWVKLHVKVQHQNLVFQIEDTGIGMSETQLAVIFESFKQGDNSITRRFGGSGLGLCLSQQLANMMAGNISVKSQFGAGSCFQLTLPYKPMEGVKNEDVLLPATPVQTALKGTVVLAEDHDENRALAVRILQGFGLEVIAVGNGKLAVEAALYSYPDVLLLDIQMPEMDGISALSLLRQSGYSGPVFALTANVMTHEVAHYLDIGFTGHLGKPFDAAAMYQQIAPYFQHTDEKRQVFSVDMSDLRDSFILSFDEERMNLISHFENQDWLAVKALCHKLQGAAKVFQIETVAAAAAEFEHAIETAAQHRYQDYYLILCDELALIANSKQLDVS
ncbi:tetratricopeptide repeat protein [Pseudoalteromonas fenneropenaei]|uniref:histidine kinase n=1 Tax=Pseudoalteromonas fenneropenaei TaxID=1737459 RepID=A0ABV7CP66_9GAMM